MSEKVLFGEITKPNGDKIRITLNEWEGREYIDLRIYYDASTGEEADPRPTKKGITIKAENLGELKLIIEKAIKHFQ